MAVGQSGRIVLEIDPALKRALHARLVGEGMTMKDWFLRQVDEFLDPKQQSLPLGSYTQQGGAPLLRVAEPRTQYSKGKR